jgi:hypothetical protein
MDRDVLLHQMTERFQALYSKALDALESAPDGRWIADSEWAFRGAFQQLLTESYEAAVQSKVDAHPSSRQASFSPSGPRHGGSAGDAAQR